MKKSNRIKIRLVSSEKTGYFYVTYKNTKKTTEKIRIKKYDPVIKKRVLFKESKI